MTATRYESHAWGGGVDGDECVACGVTWQDCDEDCTRRPTPAHRAHTGMTTHENGDAMTALPSADLTDAEALTLARIEAEPDAPESLRERVAQAVQAELDRRCPHCLRPIADEQDWALIPEGEGEHLCWEPDSCGIDIYGLDLPHVAADAALDVLRGTTDDAWIVAQLRALLREQDPDAVPIIARADLEAILDGDGTR